MSTPPCRKTFPQLHGLTLPMLRLLSSKGQGRKDSWKPSKPCHVGTHWIALAEYSQMSTHLPGFHWFFRIFALFCIGQIGLQQHKGSMVLSVRSGKRLLEGGNNTENEKELSAARRKQLQQNEPICLLDLTNPSYSEATFVQSPRTQRFL